MSEIKPSRFSYNFLIEFFYNFELCDHTSYYPLLYSTNRNRRCKYREIFWNKQIISQEYFQ